MTDPKTFPIQDYRPIPWSLIAPHEAQAMKNHGGQTLRRLAERQGLSPCEALCAIRGEGIGKLLREPHGLRRDAQTGETICRCTCAHELKELAEKHRRESSAPSELQRLQEALRIAEQERDGLRATLEAERLLTATGDAAFAKRQLRRCRREMAELDGKRYQQLADALQSTGARPWNHLLGRAAAGWAAMQREKRLRKRLKDDFKSNTTHAVGVITRRFQAEIEALRDALRIAEATRNAAQAIATRETLRRREVEAELAKSRETRSPAFERCTATGSLLVRAGDVLEGVEGDVTTRIRVTYVSEETLLARQLRSRRTDGKEVGDPGRESTWTLSCRDWRKVEEGHDHG